MLLTQKQQSIMKQIIAGDGEAAIDLDQLLERLDYKTSKESLQFSLRALIGHGLIRKAERELRRDRIRQTVVPTTFGKEIYSEYVPRFVSDISDDTELLDLIEEK
jgi:hypothetical protein